jgi:hypothetical protein
MNDETPLPSPTGWSRCVIAALVSRADAARVERITLGLDPPALAGVAVAGEALGDEPPDPLLARSRARRGSVPSVRSRLVWEKLRSRFLEKPASARAVAWQMIAPGRAAATASRTAVASSASRVIGSAPRARTCPALPGEWQLPITS